MQDPESLFHRLALRERDEVLDLGCGRGDYALRASRIVGEMGAVQALDRNANTIEGLRRFVSSQRITNVFPMVHDITEPLPFDAGRFRLCLLAMVLHTLDLRKDCDRLFREISRILAREGRIAILECKKEDAPLGPPKSVRLSPDDVERLVARHGFEKVDLVDFGYNYLIQFMRLRSS
jgi:ubiquinone/menaquinone biosynthesis C-methylase UbiE